LAFDSLGDLFAADRGSGNIYKYTRDGVRSTFAAGFAPNAVSGLAVNSAGDLFAAVYGNGSIYEFTPGGVRSTFASGLDHPRSLVFDRSGNLFVAESSIYKYSPSGVRSWFAAPENGASSLAIDPSGTLFVGGAVDYLYFTHWGEGSTYIHVYAGTIETFRADGVRDIFVAPSLVPSLAFGVGGLAFDSQGYLFAASGSGIYAYPPDGKRGTFATGLPFYSIAVQPPIPEPSATTGLLAIGIAGFVLLGWRRLG
jgi:sugar lactone lactonase YvrE